MTWEVTFPALALLVGILVNEWFHKIRDDRTTARSDARWAAQFQREGLVEVNRLVDLFEQSLESVVMPQMAEFDRTARLPAHDSYSAEMRAHMTARRQLDARLKSVVDPDIRSLGKLYLDVSLPAVQDPPPGQADEQRYGVIVDALRARASVVDELLEVVGGRLRDVGIGQTQ
ncbi:MAG: hypothetical protein IH941_01525 [Acidobacteria bacterium]|nr:hypothetical protein [Acidobacteriota bacterium]